MSEATRVKLPELGLKDHRLKPGVDDRRMDVENPPDLAPWRPNFHDSFSRLNEPSNERSSKIVDPRPRFDSFPPRPVKIAIKSKGKILLISPADILAVEAEGNYVLLLRHSDSHLLRESISTMAEKLKRYHFVRIHRSVLVNASSVEEIYTGGTGEYILRMSGGKQYIVSRTYKNNLKLLAQAWIGTDSFVDE